MSKADRHTDRQKVHKGFLILLLAHTLFTSSGAPKVLLKAGTVEKTWRENKKMYRKKCAPLGPFKTKTPILKNLMCK